MPSHRTAQSEQDGRPRWTLPHEALQHRINQEGSVDRALDISEVGGQEHGAIAVRCDALIRARAKVSQLLLQHGSLRGEPASPLRRKVSPHLRARLRADMKPHHVRSKEFQDVGSCKAVMCSTLSCSFVGGGACSNSVDRRQGQNVCVGGRSDDDIRSTAMDSPVAKHQTLPSSVLAASIPIEFGYTFVLRHGSHTGTRKTEKKG
jgi:hypothetical protein